MTSLLLTVEKSDAGGCQMDSRDCIIARCIRRLLRVPCRVSQTFVTLYLPTGPALVPLDKDGQEIIRCHDSGRPLGFAWFVLDFEHACYVDGGGA